MAEAFVGVADDANGTLVPEPRPDLHQTRIHTLRVSGQLGRAERVENLGR